MTFPFSYGAFQRNAFQNNAFQVAAAFQSGAKGSKEDDYLWQREELFNYDNDAIAILLLLG